MRVMLTISPVEYAPFNKITKHTIQGALYNLLIGTDYENLHNKKGFKFFTFSDVFPAKDYYPNKKYSFIISSPDRRLINTWYRALTHNEYLYLSDVPFKIANVKKYDLPLKNKFISGSPVVLYENSEENRYFSFQRNNDVDFFLERLKDNALKKYNAYYDDEFYIEGQIFDMFSLKKEVSVKVTIKKEEFNIIGSVWNILGKSYMNKDECKFYKFLMDCGLGEKNSLGFGLVNPVKEGGVFKSD